jgi:3-oxoacyl-[acyl-carrier-protein] synthase-3
MKVKVLGTGAYVPEKILTNAHFESLVETSDQWIVERTGIRERRASRPDEPTSDLAAAAGRRALEAAGTSPEEVDTIIVATSSPDRIVPPTAVYAQAKLGCFNAGCYDLIAACTGFVYGLHTGATYVASGRSKRCLVIGAEELTKITDMKDRATCILFGDAAGAAVLGPSDGASEILYSRLGCDGRLDDLIIVREGGTACASNGQAPGEATSGIRMKGREVYKFAVPKFVEIIREAVAACGLTLADIAHFIPHQMNARMIEAVAERLGFPMERVVLNIDRYGNTSAASIPVALDEAVRAGRVRRGDVVLMSAMGAGITWGTAVLRW